MKVLILAFALLVASVLPVAAQTITNPSAIGFDSADHLTLDGAGVPLVSSYTLPLTQIGAAAPFTTLPVAKALVTGTSPNYQVLFSALPAYPIGVTFTAQLIAVGPGGSSAASNASNPFSHPDPAPRAATGVVVR